MQLRDRLHLLDQICLLTVSVILLDELSKRLGLVSFDLWLGVLLPSSCGKPSLFLEVEILEDLCIVSAVQAPKLIFLQPLYGRHENLLTEMSAFYSSFLKGWFLNIIFFCV